MSLPPDNRTIKVARKASPALGAVAIALLVLEGPVLRLAPRRTLFDLSLLSVVFGWGVSSLLLLRCLTRRGTLSVSFRALPFLRAVFVVAGAFFLLDFLGTTSGRTTFAVAGLAAATLLLRLLSVDDPKETVNRALLTFASSIAAVVLLEMLFHVIVEPKIPRTNQEFHRWIASSWPRPIPEEKEAGRFRILGCADSFGVDGASENYHYVLEGLLRAKGYPEVELVNLSESALEPIDESKLLERFGPRYHPDLVLHGFFVGNDFYVPRGELVVLGGIEFRLPDGWKRIRPRDFALREWLARACAIVQNRALQAGERKRREEVGVLAREELLRIEFRVMVHALLRYPYYPAPEERWKEAVEILDRIKDEVGRMGAKYVMVIHPDQVQVDAALFRELCEMGGVSSDMFETDLPQRFLLDYCRARNIPCIDLLPAFRERSRRTRLYSFGDTHYNEEGNRLAAEEIFRFLTDRGLVPIRKPG